MSYLDTLEWLGKGVLLALIPGLHPMIFNVSDPYLLGILYGAFTGMSIVLARKGIYHPDTAGEGPFTLKDILHGLLLGLLLIPVAYVLYSVQLPRTVLFVLLVLGTITLLKSPAAFLLSALLGIVLLRFPSSVHSPLASGLLYLFGMKYILGGDFSKEEGNVKRGVLASLLTGYFPALPSSAWSRIVGKGNVAVAALLTPIYSLVNLYYGKTRAVMTSFISYPAPYILTLSGVSFTLTVLLILSLAEVLRMEKISLPKEVGIIFLFSHGVYFGVGNLLALIASAALVYLTKKDDPASYFGFLVVPTLLYYA